MFLIVVVCSYHCGWKPVQEILSIDISLHIFSIQIKAQIIWTVVKIFYLSPYLMFGVILSAVNTDDL